jgi:RNA polymerase sigma factor (TIGR02999 family)
MPRRRRRSRGHCLDGIGGDDIVLAVPGRPLRRSAMGEITQWLRAAGGGDAHALGQVFDQLYPTLRRIARGCVQAGERSLTPTALVHEAYVSLIGNRRLTLNDRRHFLACAARAMRAIMIDHARRRSAAKRGGRVADLPLDAIDFQIAAPHDDEALLALDESLDLLQQVNPRQREVVELRYFIGLEFVQVAELLGCSERTAKREWERARAFLHAQSSD